ncbi:MAG: hypothetical protein ACLU5J_08120 [Christensenellales bacterium]
MTQYKTLLNIVNIKSFKDYLYYYNLYLKFTGNYQYLIEVECKNGQGKKIIKPQYQNYQNLFQTLINFFPRGKNKKNKNIEYTVNNLPQTDKISLEKSYNELHNYMKDINFKILEKVCNI